MTRIELSSNKDRGYTITAIKTNKKYYNFKCGALAVALDVPAAPPTKKEPKKTSSSASLATCRRQWTAPSSPTCRLFTSDSTRSPVSRRSWS